MPPFTSTRCTGLHVTVIHMQAPASVVAGTVEAIWSPNIQVGKPIETRPMAGAVVEALHEGNAVAATTTDEAGRYELRVQPGTYLIHVKDNRRSFPGETVTISTGETLTVDFLLDIGIRCHQGHQPARCPLRTRCRWVNRSAKKNGRPTE